MIFVLCPTLKVTAHNNLGLKPDKTLFDVGILIDDVWSYTTA